METDLALPCFYHIHLNFSEHFLSVRDICEASETFRISWNTHRKIQHHIGTKN